MAAKSTADLITEAIALLPTATGGVVPNSPITAVNVLTLVRDILQSYANVLDTGVTFFGTGGISTNGPVNSKTIFTNSTNPLVGTFGSDQTISGVTVQVDQLNVGTNVVRGFNFYHNFGGASAFGYRIGSQFSLQQTSPTALTNTARAYTALEALMLSDNGDGGSGIGSTAGSYWAFNPFIQLGAGAVYTTEASGMELNTNLLSGSSTLDKYGYKVVQFGTDAAQGSRNDAAFFAANIAGAVGWKAIIQIGDTVNQSPLATNGSILVIKGSPTFDKGIDLSGAGTITTAAFKSPGFSVNGSGATVALTYGVGANQVVGARVTGYTAMTGSPDKATAYATGSVTLAQLAGRVAQLQADLTAHGLIGA